MAARDLLDPRWHWLRQAVGKLYRELDADTKTMSLSLAVETDAGELLVYQMATGHPDVHKLILSGEPDAIGDAVLANTLSMDPPQLDQQ